MNRIISLLIMLIFYNISFAQTKLTNDDLILGKPYPVIDAGTKKYFSHKNIIIAIKYNGKVFTIQTFDSKKLSLIKVKTYDDFPKNYEIETYLELNDKIYLFYSVWDKSNKKEQLFSREIDPSSCSFKDKGKLVLSVNGKATGTLSSSGFYRYSTYDKFEFQKSFEENRLLIQYRKPPEKKSDKVNKDVIGFHVFDGNLSPIWNKEVRMPYTEKKMDNLDYTVDSEGNAILASLIYRDNTTKKLTKDKEINYDIELITVMAKSGEVVQNKLQLADKKHISELRLFEAPNNEIICTGYYSTGGISGKKTHEINGVFKFNLTKNGNSKINYYDIPIEVINQNLAKKTVEKNIKKEKKKQAKDEDEDEDGGVGLANLVPETIYIASDGSVYLIGERQHSVTTTYTDSKGNVHSKTTYYYNDILVTKINSNNSLGWMRKLPKAQRGASPRGGMSFKFIDGEKDMYLIYIDNIKNITLPSDEAPKTHIDGAGGFFTTYKLNYKTGDIEKISLFDTKNIKEMEVYQFSPERVVFISNKEFVFEVYKKKKEDILIKAKLY